MKQMKEILEIAEEIITDESRTVKERLQALCDHLNRNEKKYTWVGFYIMNHETRHLHLGPFTGKETDHTVIPFGKGICGQVAESGHTYTAEDVSAEGNYIACSHDVRSEIVIPIYDGEKLTAQLDIDSVEVNAFSREDQQMLEDICRSIGEKLGSEMHFKKFFGEA